MGFPVVYRGFDRNLFDISTAAMIAYRIDVMLEPRIFLDPFNKNSDEKVRSR